MAKRIECKACRGTGMMTYRKVPPLRLSTTTAIEPPASDDTEQRTCPHCKGARYIEVKK